jgi:isocitrate/isopropylmalate dehydrogenase
MTRQISVCLIPGDGIGPEVVNCARAVLDAISAKPGAPAFSYDEHTAGFGAYENGGDPLPAPTIAAVKKADATLLGALDVARIPAGVAEPLTRLRTELGVNASVRPAVSLPGAPIQIDTIVVREVTEGIYSGIEYRTTPDAACAVRVITRQASEKVARVAFELAQGRRKKVTAVHKIGLLKLTDGLFLEACRDVGRNYPDVKFETRNVDACALELIREPNHFDVIVATNAFGDILSDVAIGLGAGLGLAPSGCVGDRWAYFEPVHGTAPDIAGQGIANPIATILTAAMMLRHLGEVRWAEAIETAVRQVLDAGQVRTRDLGGRANSTEMTDAIITALQ